MEKTAWQMPILEPYKTGHILIMITGFSLCAFFLYKCRNYDEKKTGKLMFVIGVLLTLSEVYKELFLATVWQTGYSWGDFPLQLCSMPMYFGIAYPYLRGKAKDIVTTFLATFNLIGGFAAVFEPSSSFYSYVTMTCHSVIWHYVLVFMGLKLWFSTIKIDNFKGAEILYLVLGAIAYFLNWLLMGLSQGTMNLFFVGPGVAPIIFFDNISVKYGPVAESLLFLAVSSGAAFAIYIVGRHLRNVIEDGKIKTDEI